MQAPELRLRLKPTVTTKDLNYLWIGLICWGLAVAFGILLQMDLRYWAMFGVLAALVLIPIALIVMAFYKRHYFVGIPLVAILVLAWTLLPPRSYVRDAANRMLAASNLRNAAIAMHNYHHDHGHMPPPSINPPDDKPLLSWRVAILPYIGQQELYREFRLNEPWDSEHNRKLIPRMPDIYRSVGKVNCPEHHTFIQAFVGPGTILDPQRRVTLGQITLSRGTSNKLLAAEGGNPVIWTKPEDIPFTVENGIGPIGGQFPEGGIYVGVNVVFADGSVRSLRPPYPMEVLREAVQWQSNKQVEIDWE